jgi:predicted ester cyclase
MADGRAPFSAFHHTIEDQVAEGDRVVTRVRGRAIHDRREAMGVAPTGEEYEASGIIIDRVVGARSSSSGGVERRLNPDGAAP